MSKIMKSYFQFERLIGELLVANGFTIKENVILQGNEFDFIGMIENDTFAIEVKYYRTERAQVSLLQSAAAQLVRKQREARIAKGMLIVACSIDPELRDALESNYGLVVVDRADIFNWVRKAPAVADELTAMLEISDTPTKIGSRDISESLHASRTTTVELPPADTQGTTLCSELRQLKRGKASWASYEKLCDRILRYLFPNDLHGWHAQKRTDDGLSRFDYVCRVRATTDFWKFLIDHLDSRYVLFEFKNYSGEIKQGQVLTTEKYLLEKALRRVAIIFCRAGADKGATTMMQGAMREHGKLMLIIDDEKVCKMLQMKERGEDPSDLLFEAADDFLLALPR